MAPPLPQRRDITSTLADAGNTLSSWGNCMNKAYCKWPVIVAIILASLLVLSLLLCLFRCLCFGAECCCGCLSCCNACCPSPRRRRGRGGKDRGGGKEYVEEGPGDVYQAPTQQQQQQQQQAYLPPGQAYSAPRPWQPQPQPYQQMGYGQGVPPQYALLGAPRGRAGVGGNEDALPAMPSWDTARSRRVEDMEEREEQEEGVDIGGAGVGGDDAGAEEEDIASGRMGVPHQQQDLYTQRQPTLPRISAGAEAEEYAHSNLNQRNVPIGGEAQREQYGSYTYNYNNTTNTQAAYNIRPSPPPLYNARAPAPAPQSPSTYSYSYYAPEPAAASESHEHRVPRGEFGSGFYEPVKRAPAPPPVEGYGEGSWYPPPVGQRQQQQQPRGR